MSFKEVEQHFSKAYYKRKACGWSFEKHYNNVKEFMKPYQRKKEAKINDLGTNVLCRAFSLCASKRAVKEIEVLFDAIDLMNGEQRVALIKKISERIKRS